MKKEKMPKKDKTDNSGKKVSPKAKENNTLTIVAYFVLRFLVILCMVGQSIHGNWNNVFLCLLTLILFTLPTIISRTFHITLPDTLEIIVYLFIFSSEILGEIQNFYGIFSHWDTMLHTLNGFLCAAVGFSLIDILNNTDNFHIKMTPSFVALVAFCFSMTIGVLWEFGEFAADRYLNKDMQKDRIVQKVTSVKLNPEGENIPIILENIKEVKIYSNQGEKVTVIEGGYLELGLIDTMKDLFVNFIGAIVFSTIGYLYIKNRDDYKFAERFIPRLKSKLE